MTVVNQRTPGADYNAPFSDRELWLPVLESAV
jgi:hypothetical protein